MTTDNYPHQVTTNKPIDKAQYIVCAVLVAVGNHEARRSRPYSRFIGVAASSYLALMLTAVRAGPPPCWAHAARHRPRAQGGRRIPAKCRARRIDRRRHRRRCSVRQPSRFDVIVTTNMFGDILSDEASELTGSLGLGGAINASDTICVAQAQHGSAPDIAGQGVANPTSLILSVAMLLDWIGQRRGDSAFIEAGQLITRAIDRADDNPETRTRDIGGSLGTEEFTHAVLAAMDDIR